MVHEVEGEQREAHPTPKLRAFVIKATKSVEAWSIIHEPTGERAVEKMMWMIDSGAAQWKDTTDTVFHMVTIEGDMFVPREEEKEG